MRKGKYDTIKQNLTVIPASPGIWIMSDHHFLGCLSVFSGIFTINMYYFVIKTLIFNLHVEHYASLCREVLLK